jgi:hypothetical protein
MENIFHKNKFFYSPEDGEATFSRNVGKKLSLLVA